MIIRPQKALILLYAWLCQGSKWITNEGLAGISLLFGCAYLALIMGMEFIGEKFWLTGLLLYFPTLYLATPALALLAVCWLFQRRLCGLQLGCLSLVIFVGMDFQWPARIPADIPTIKILTKNLGELKRYSAMPLLKAQNPDLIVLQDATHHGPVYARKFPERHYLSVGEFTLISKFPIQQAQYLFHSGPENIRHPIGVRYELMIGDHVVVLYNIHLPTPRAELSECFKQMVQSANLHSGWRAVASYYRHTLRMRFAAITYLQDKIRQEQTPYIIAGDCNVPDQGHFYRILADLGADAFEAAGHGYGYTFPGDLQFEFVCDRPWLRLDYLFCSREFITIQCQSELEFHSEHGAVIAKIASHGTGIFPEF